jgi:hypothetical protein
MAPPTASSTAAVAVTAVSSSHSAATDASALSPELWAEVLKKLRSPADLCAAVSTCSSLRDAFVANRSTVWGALLASPRIEPYASGPWPRGVTEPPDAGESRPQCENDTLCQSAMRLRSAWRSARCCQQSIAFPSFVRCVKVDWESDTLAVGLHDGSVYVCDLHGEARWGFGGTVQVSVGEGSHASGQVLALDRCGKILVSGSGNPSYTRQPCPGATLRVVRLKNSGFWGWSQMYELGARDGGHVDSINAIKIVEIGEVAHGEIGAGEGSCVACSASSDQLLLVWDLVAGRPLRQLAAHRAPVTALALVGADHPATAAGGTHGAGALRWSVATLLSCAHDGEVREWDWRAGTCTRVVLAEPSPSPHAAFSALSFHRATSSFALGSQSGCVRLYRYSPRHEAERELSCYPLTQWRGARAPHGGTAGSSRPPGPTREVASLTHDGDKLAYVTREGVLDLLWLGPHARHGSKRRPGRAATCHLSRLERTASGLGCSAHSQGLSRRSRPGRRCHHSSPVCTRRLPDEEQPFGMCASGESVRRVNSEREAEVSRRLEMAKSDPLRHDPLGHGVTRYEAEAQAETQLAHADIESGMRAAVRMYVSTIEIRGNLLVSDGFDNHVVVLRMGEKLLPLSEDEAGDDDDDDDDDSREDEGDDGEEGSEWEDEMGPG